MSEIEWEVEVDRIIEMAQSTKDKDFLMWIITYLIRAYDTDYLKKCNKQWWKHDQRIYKKHRKSIIHLKKQSICISCGQSYEQLRWMGKRCNGCQETFNARVNFILFLICMVVLGVILGGR